LLHMHLQGQKDWKSQITHKKKKHPWISKKITTIDTKMIKIKIDVKLRLGLGSICFVSLIKPFHSFNLVNTIFTRMKPYRYCILKITIQCSI
jgi:hypothetical protein